MKYMKTSDIIMAIKKLPEAESYPYNECEVSIPAELNPVMRISDRPNGNDMANFKTIRFCKIGNYWNLRLD